MDKYYASGILYCASGEIKILLEVNADTREQAKYLFAHTNFPQPEEGTLIIDYRSVKKDSSVYTVRRFGIRYNGKYYFNPCLFPYRDKEVRIKYDTKLKLLHVFTVDEHKFICLASAKTKKIKKVRN